MNNSGNMGYSPKPKSPAPAAPVDEGPEIYDVPLRPVPTLDAKIGGRAVTFAKPKLAGMRLIAKHGKSLMAAAAAMNAADGDALDPELVEIQFDALDQAEEVLRALVPYMVGDKDQRAWVTKCFDMPEIDQAELIGVMLRILGRVNNTTNAAEAVAAAEAEASAEPAGPAEIAASVPDITPAAADVDEIVVVDLDEHPGAAAA